MNLIRTPIRKLLESAGLDVRLIRNLEQARLAAKRQAVIDRWKLLSRYQPRTVLDLGANEGQFAQMIRKILPDAILYSFEPLSDCYERVDQFLKQSGPGKAIPVAIGAENGTSVIHRSAFSPSSSLLKMGKLHAEEFPETATTQREEIQVRRLDDVVKELELETPVVMKVDVQGFENQVIEGGRETLSKTSAVVMELTSYALYENQSTFESVQPAMESLGFVFRGVVDQMHSPRDGRILQFDALFENTALVSDSFDGDRDDAVMSKQIS